MTTRMPKAKNATNKASVKKALAKKQMKKKDLKKKGGQQSVGWQHRPAVDLKALVSRVPLVHPTEPVGEAWPREDLVYYGMPSPCDWGPLLTDVLAERGWKFGGLPCHCVSSKCSSKVWHEEMGFTVFMKEFAASLEGKHPTEVFGKECAEEEGYRLKKIDLPKRALWMMNSSAFRMPGGIFKFREEFANVVAKHGKSLPTDGSYRMCSFPGMETALKKTNLSNAFRNKPWWPRCYTIPDENADLLKDIQANKGSRLHNYWICKPPNDYGGCGISVFHGNDPDLRQLIKESKDEGRQVVQNYLADPYLIGGYKFHVRIHMAITSLDPPEAYVQLNGQCLFATEPYTLSRDTLGEKFKAPVHVTNMTLNATSENKENYFREKPIIGSGQQFRVQFLEEYLTENHPGYSSEAFWKQVVAIAADTVRYIASARSVRQFGKSFPANRFFEIFGMDLMLDKKLDMYMCEVNTTPGLDYPDELILGEPNPDYEKETSLSGDALHDLMALLGLDSSVPQERGSLQSWWKVDMDHQM